MSNRIEQISATSETATRRLQYRELDRAVSRGRVLDVKEVDFLLDQLAIEPEAVVRVSMWRLLLRQEADPRILKFCNDWVHDPTAPDRYAALEILRQRLPEGPARLGTEFLRDPDPVVRYEAALCLLSQSPQEALAVVVDSYIDLPLGLQEEAEMYLAERGGPAEVRRVRVNAALHKEGNAYKTLLRMLEANLAAK